MKIAVFCPNAIGDCVMATPTLRALRRGFPAATIAGIIRPQVAPTLDGTTWLDFLIPFDPRSSQLAQRTVAVVRRLRRERFDLAVLLPNSFRVAAMAWLGGIPRRIGHVRYARGCLLTERLYYPRDGAGRRLPFPIVESYLEITRRLGCEVDSTRVKLATTPGDEAAAEHVYAALGLGSRDRVVCLNTGGAFGPAKDWPAAHFARLARELADQSGAAILVLCGPRERAAAREIAQLAGHPRVVSLAEQTLSIGLTKACVRRSRVLITTDSGPRHFAAAFDIPVITLYGPTHIAWTRTDHPEAWDLFHPVPCGPCQRPVCPEGHHRCMRNLSPESVLGLALRVLARHAPDKSATVGEIGENPRFDAVSQSDQERSCTAY
jgi:heptosyltransferase-2